MKKRIVILCLSMLVCPVFPAAAISEEQEAIISDQCGSIIETLKKVQREDSRTRVYLGGYYETILTKFITPLNMRLVENNLSNAGLVENQNKFAEAKTTFVDDFISYQKMLEGLVAMDCTNEPAKFYESLVNVRQKRKVMNQDVLKLRSLISEHIKLVTELRSKV